MKTLCRKAGVKYFRFHALRRAGASIMDNSNVPIVAIQEILCDQNGLACFSILSIRDYVRRVGYGFLVLRHRRSGFNPDISEQLACQRLNAKPDPILLLSPRIVKKHDWFSLTREVTHFEAENRLYYA